MIRRLTEYRFSVSPEVATDWNAEHGGNIKAVEFRFEVGCDGTICGKEKVWVPHIHMVTQNSAGVTVPGEYGLGGAVANTCAASTPEQATQLICEKYLEHRGYPWFRS